MFILVFTIYYYMEIDTNHELSQEPRPIPNGLNLIRTQKKLRLKRIFEIIKKNPKGIKVKELIAKLYIEEGSSKARAKEDIEMLYNGHYISIEGQDSIVKIKRDLDATS